MKCILILLLAFSGTTFGDVTTAYIAMTRKMSPKGKNMFNYANRGGDHTRYQYQTPDGIRVIEPRLKDAEVYDTFGSFNGEVSFLNYNIPRTTYQVWKSSSLPVEGGGLRVIRELGVPNRQTLVEEVAFHAELNVGGRPLRIIDSVRSSNKSTGQTLSSIREKSGNNELLRLTMKWDATGKTSQTAIPVNSKYGRIVGWEVSPSLSDVMIYTSEGHQIRYTLQHKDGILTSSLRDNFVRWDNLREARVKMNSVGPQTQVKDADFGFEIPSTGVVQ